MTPANQHFNKSEMHSQAQMKSTCVQPSFSSASSSDSLPSSILPSPAPHPHPHLHLLRLPRLAEAKCLVRDNISLGNSACVARPLAFLPRAANNVRPSKVALRAGRSGSPLIPCEPAVKRTLPAKPDCGESAGINLAAQKKREKLCRLLLSLAVRCAQSVTQQAAEFSQIHLES